jgi:carbamoyl-phosphate synthase large subunit
MPADTSIHTILLIGSGPIVIGQACEFDYSGTQAVKALQEEGYRVVLVNPNPATVMTTPGIADSIYMEPLHPEYLEEIIKAERPDSLIPTMGGQTGLNTALRLHEEGILEKYGVNVIGAHIDAIQVAEDRGRFKEVVRSIGLESPVSVLAREFDTAKQFMEENGFPLIIRPSYTLGGQGGSIAYTKKDFEILVEKAFLESPVHEALIEESLLGWKEFEMEVMRDRADNAVIVCSIENVDSMGIHTGDSITVAPIQTLSDREYQEMRTASIDILRAVGVDCGGSNVQFAVQPETGRMVVIEMNPRVSRSSALASKATGFPIARCSAKLAVGYTLDEITNEITGKTVSCFEPVLDYCAVKVPRFELEKFPRAYDELGTQMKSIGESLALGRTFTEALNKAIRAAEFGFEGVEELAVGEDVLENMLTKLHPRRIFAAYTLLKREGESAVSEIHRRTRYDRWFLYQLLELAEVEHRLEEYRDDAADRNGEFPRTVPGSSEDRIESGLLLRAKQLGISDRRLETLTGLAEEEIFLLRKDKQIRSTYHFVDTCAGEFTASTPYFYSTYGEVDEGESDPRDGVVILASGPNRIGQGLEFDTCCTLASLAYRKLGIRTVIVNSNPETVSTDFNVSDRLYMEPLTPEHVCEVTAKEKIDKVLVQLGGQTPLNMAGDLIARGADIVGTSIRSIEGAEDRGLFVQLLHRLELEQPKNRMAKDRMEVIRFAEEIGFPVLLRPSFVLGGRSMFIAFTNEELYEFLDRGIAMSPERPVLVDQFLEDAFEYDLDAVCDGKNVYIAGIMQHIEAAGVHSGDSACVFPPFKSKEHILKEMKDATLRIAREIGVQGFINIQFAEKNGILYLLEVNPRASRTVPFLSKASGVNLVEAAVRVWEGENLEAQGLTRNGFGEGVCKTDWAVKEAVFSFGRFPKEDPLLGPEMKSTGEVIGVGASFGEAFAKAQASTGSRLPVYGRVFVSVHEMDRQTILPVIRELEELGFDISATRGTAEFLFKNGIFAEVIQKIQEGRPNIIDHLQRGRIDLIINTPLGRFSQKGDHELRIEAVRRKVPYTTTTSAALAAVEGIRYIRSEEAQVRKIPAWSGEL